MTYPYGVSALASGTGASTDPLNVYFHTKSGGTWETVTVDTGVAHSGIFGVIVANNGDDFLVVVDASAALVVYRSLDAGETWAEVVADLSTTWGAALYYLGTEWVLVDDTASGPVLWVSSDGLTWAERSGPDITTLSAPLPGHIMADANDRIHTIAKSGAGLEYAYTDDNGVTWSVPQSVLATAPEFFGLAVSGSVVLVVGVNNYDTQHIYQAVSLDGGDTWSSGAYLNAGLFPLANWTWGGDMNSATATPLLIVDDSLYMVGSAYADYGGGDLRDVAGILVSTDWADGLPTWSSAVSVSESVFEAWRSVAVSADPAGESGEIVLGGPTTYPAPLKDPIDLRQIASVSLATGALTAIYNLTGAGSYYGMPPAGGGEYAGSYSLYFSFYRIGGPNVNVYLF